MKRIHIVILSVAALFCIACNNSPKVRTYEDAERAFLASLTPDDTVTVKTMCDDFMKELASGQLDSALNRLCVVENSMLYKVSDNSIEKLRKRFQTYPVHEFELSRISFSTQGNNDVCYRYSCRGPLGEGAGMKIVFNPVKVGKYWFLCLKDGSQSSLDLPPSERVHPHSPAPNPIVVGRKVTLQ